MNCCSLGFTLRLAVSHADLMDACAVRAGAYGHHVPEIGDRMAEPEPLDRAEGTAVFICRDKATGQATGTMRIQHSRFGALMMEGSLALPGWLAAAPRVEITRLAVCIGADPLTKLCLMKASYLYCMAERAQWMVIGARNEALIRNYRRLGFVDVLRRDELVPLLHTGGLPHRILAFDVPGAERTWAAARHPLYGFMVDTHHEDVRVEPIQPAFDLLPAYGRVAAAA